MKILVVHLLRLGDVLMAQPVLASLRRRFPNAQLDLLINKQAVGAVEFLPQFKNTFLFDRDGLQNSLGDANQSVFEAYDRVNDLVCKLNREHYDLVINLTQNKLSGLLCGALVAEDKLGMAIDPNGQVEFGNPWFRHLNQDQSGRNQTVFHFNDIFFGSLDLAKSHRKKLRVAGQQDWVLQTSTSDEAKHWSKETLVEFINSLTEMDPQSSVQLLGAPSELNRLENIKNLLKHRDQIQILALGLRDAKNLIAEAKALITFDTSIKHLAALTETPIIELVKGPSDPRRTGTYRNRSLVLRVSEQLQPGFVEAILSFAAGDLERLESQCSFANLEAHLVECEAIPFYALKPVSGEKYFAFVDEVLKKAALRLHFQHRQGGLDEIGTESYRIAHCLAHHNSRSHQEVLDQLQMRIRNQYEQFRLAQANSTYARFADDFVRLRQEQESARATHSIMDFEKRILNSVRTQLLENKI